MAALEQIEQSINALKQQDYAHFRDWFYQKDARLWDEKLTADSNSGALDFLLDEAKSQKNSAQLKPL